MEAAGPWVPGLLAAVEARLAEVGAAHGARLAE
ncbi:MAG: hypothetical protein JWO90_194, partial [Solirubrobacterales bacterium]|nr:hypothetical protein [Solirubrobacterales bacterium]